MSAKVLMFQNTMINEEMEIDIRYNNRMDIIQHLAVVRALCRMKLPLSLLAKRAADERGDLPDTTSKLLGSALELLGKMKLTLENMKTEMLMDPDNGNNDEANVFTLANIRQNLEELVRKFKGLVRDLKVNSFVIDIGEKVVMLLNFAKNETEQVFVKTPILIATEVVGNQQTRYEIIYDLDNGNNLLEAIKGVKEESSIVFEDLLWEAQKYDAQTECVYEVQHGDGTYGNLDETTVFGDLSGRLNPENALDGALESEIQIEDFKLEDSEGDEVNSNDVDLKLDLETRDILDDISRIVQEIPEPVTAALRSSEDESKSSPNNTNEILNNERIVSRTGAELLDKGRMAAVRRGKDGGVSGYYNIRRAILSGQGDVIDGLDIKELVEIKDDR